MGFLDDQRCFLVAMSNISAHVMTSQVLSLLGIVQFHEGTESSMICGNNGNLIGDTQGWFWVNFI